jgi:hypothetical protein
MLPATVTLMLVVGTGVCVGAVGAVAGSGVRVAVGTGSKGTAVGGDAPAQATSDTSVTKDSNSRINLANTWGPLYSSPYLMRYIVRPGNDTSTDCLWKTQGGQSAVYELQFLGPGAWINRPQAHRRPEPYVVIDVQAVSTPPAGPYPSSDTAIGL